MDTSSSFHVCQARSTRRSTWTSVNGLDGRHRAHFFDARRIAGSSAVPDCLIVGEGSRDGERKRSSRSGYERVRRDAKTTRYFLRLPGITMFWIWPLDAVHSTGWDRVRPSDAGSACAGDTRAQRCMRPCGIPSI